MRPTTDRVWQGDQQAQSLAAQLEAALAERNRLWTDAERVPSLELELAHTRAIITEMKGSVSWRLTSPLRTARDQVRVQKKLAGRVRKAVRGG